VRSLVLAEIPIAAERLRAAGARERPVGAVRLLVVAQLAGSVECAVAALAREPPLEAVHVFVRLEVVGAGEDLAARRANVEFAVRRLRALVFAGGRCSWNVQDKRKRWCGVWDWSLLTFALHLKTAK